LLKDDFLFSPELAAIPLLAFLGETETFSCNFSFPNFSDFSDISFFSLVSFSLPTNFFHLVTILSASLEID
jgi:hypothetical protein